MSEYADTAAIAAGNNNVAGLALVSSIVADGRALLPPFYPANYSRGEQRFTTDGAPYVSGQKTKIWVSFMSLGQYTYVRDTYQGYVTAHGWLENTTEHDYNATLSFEETSAYEPINVASDNIGWAILGVKWSFKKIVIIP